jgi:hypothetical protein
LVKKVVLGGINLHNTVGAVPKVENGELVAVPPEICVFCPAPVLAPAFQVVTRVKVVLAALTAAVIVTLSLVYGALVLVSRHIVVAAAPPVRLYHPVVLRLGLGVPEPPTLVNPVYGVPAMVCAALLTLPLKYSVPMVPMNVFQSGSLSRPVEVLLISNRTRPPAFQKYLA